MNSFFTRPHSTRITPTRLCTTWPNQIDLIGFIRLNITHVPNITTRLATSSQTLHRVRGIHLPRVNFSTSLFTILPIFCFIYSFLKITDWRKFWVRKVIEALQQIQNIVDSQFSQNQASYSHFHVPPQKNEESINLKKSIEALLKSQKIIWEHDGLTISIKFPKLNLLSTFSSPTSTWRTHWLRDKYRRHDLDPKLYHPVHQLVRSTNESIGQHNEC